MKLLSMRSVFGPLLTMVSLFSATACYGLDNPDAPDYVAEFQARALPYEDKIHQQAQNTRQTLQAAAEYEKFLDAQLNQAYRQLIGTLSVREREQLRQSQRQWLRYRDAEFEFIADTWSRDTFGSSAALSRGTYRSAIIKGRVLTLLRYLASF